MLLRLMSYNIRFGGVGREKPIASVIRDHGPDLVVFQEATNPRVVEAIAAEAGMKFFAAKAGHSLAVVSRVEIAGHEWHHPKHLERAFLEISPAGTRTKIFGVHLRAIHSNWTERRRVRELRTLLHAINADRGTFHILTGDFNTLAPGERLDMRRLPRRLRLLAFVLGGRVRFRTIQIMLDEGYADGYRLLHSASGYTFPTWDPHVRLDYFFVPKDSADCIRTCEVVCEGAKLSEASDHFPLAAEIELP